MNIQEFARHLNLSVATVSKAMNGRSDVSSATRARVLEAARQLGFTPDPAARRLRRQSSDTIGFVLSYPQSSFAHPFFLNMLTGVDEVFQETNYQVIIASARSFESEIDVFKRLVERQRVDGMLFGRTRRQDERIAYLMAAEVPFVAFGRSETAQPFSFVDIDHTLVGRVGCSRFISLGHRRIALVHGPEVFMFSHHERLGYEAALRAAGIAFDPALCIEAPMTEEGGVQAARALFDLADPPTAIVCGHDLVALGVIRGVAETGRVAGKDVGIIGGDDHPIGRYIQPALTTFSAETQRAGRRMAEMLLARLGGAAAEDLQEVWPPEIVLRASDGPPREVNRAAGR
ncbi:LacI family DNA-binding transcriptional regulator [Xenophilus azovorans]|uniref:LacI family DNA-binding transcriptional regulator n=1 Tax=Xenophilus azovorans TaxID=151755 RepID=UPI00056E8140|nr:substrate-binding domain-containing protein [Xenophilus azovorans]